MEDPLTLKTTNMKCIFLLNPYSVELFVVFQFLLKKITLKLYQVPAAYSLHSEISGLL